MKKFNKKINTQTTQVKINGHWHKVTNINETRVNIKVQGLAGSFQIGHIEKYTNMPVKGE